MPYLFTYEVSALMSKMHQRGGNFSPGDHTRRILSREEIAGRYKRLWLEVIKFAKEEADGEFGVLDRHLSPAEKKVSTLEAKWWLTGKSYHGKRSLFLVCQLAGLDPQPTMEFFQERYRSQ